MRMAGLLFLLELEVYHGRPDYSQITGTYSGTSRNG